MGTARGVYESNLREEAWFASSSLLLYHVSATIQKKKGAQMNSIIPFLGLEDSSVKIEDISTEGHVRTITLSTPPEVSAPDAASTCTPEVSGLERSPHHAGYISGRDPFETTPLVLYKRTVPTRRKRDLQFHR